MITHEIIRPKPSLLQRPFETLREFKDAYVRKANNSPSMPATTEVYMPKLQYAEWVETMKLRFPVGTLVTFDRVLPLPNKEPIPLFRVVDIQEIYYLAPLSQNANGNSEPRAIYLAPERVKGQANPYPPGILRKLTVEEIRIVHLRNSEEQARREGQPPAENNEHFSG